MSSDPTVPRQCTATSKASGQRCRRSAVLDGTVCPMHGGKAPQVRGAIERRRQERAAVLAVESFGLPVIVDPHTALLEELHRTAGAVAWLGAVVADLDREAVVWGQTRSKVGGEDHGQTFEARPNAWVSLWQVERKHLVDVSRECIKAGIEERRVRLAESAGQELASVLRRVLDRLELTDAQKSLALTVVPEEFRAVAEAGTVVAGEVTA